MATFNRPAEFINKNVQNLVTRLNSSYVKFLEQKPTFTTYYHINKQESTTDKGLKMPEKMIGIKSPLRYNKIFGFPLHGIENIQLQLDDSEIGLDSEYEGEAIILPNTIHPTVDDFFTIEYLNKKYLFRITQYSYDTIKANNYYKVNFVLYSVDADKVVDLETQVVKVYYCKCENIGTDDKVLLTSEEAEAQKEIEALYKSLSEDWLNMFYKPLQLPYNTPLYMTHDIVGVDYTALFDENLVHFCNANELFYNDSSVNTLYFYEEKRTYFDYEYSLTLFDLMEHAEYSRISDIYNYYDLEPAAAPASIFLYYKDSRVKYLRMYDRAFNFVNKPISTYFPETFITAVSTSTTDALTDKLDKFIASFMIGDELATIKTNMDAMDKRHYPYNWHTYSMIPIALFVLNKLYAMYQSTEVDNIEYELGNEICCENT